MLKDATQLALRLPRSAKQFVALSVDVVLCAIAVRIAFYLRLEIWYGYSSEQLIAALTSIVLAVPIFSAAGLYSAIFRHGGASLLARVAQACMVYGLFYAFVFTFWRIEGVPRSIGILQPVVLFLLVAGSRVAASWMLRHPLSPGTASTTRRKVAVYGAGHAGRQLVQALEHSDIDVKAFIDDDAGLQRQLLLGRRIHGEDEIEELVERYGLTDILLAIPSASRRRRNEIIERMRPLPVAVRTLPGMTDLAQGRVRMQELRELDIDDLLGRDSVEPDERLLAGSIRGRLIMVTGAGGSIGSELCRQILLREPSALLLVEMTESSLYAIHKELEERIRLSESSVRVVPLLASVGDYGRISAILSAWRPSTIYHAAAYKHVPLVEYNPAEGIRNNAFGTLTMAQAAIAAGVQNFVFVSTDKAVRPTNVMGATKRLAELILQALAATGPETCFSMVRFGNVLGSSGSVVPLFRDQISKGGPITLTHRDVVRYFMTIPEASQLVIQAGAMASGGEVFVLDMGDPVKVIDLARRMIELSGLTVRDADRPDGDIALETIGLRPGEKLHEELLIGNDPVASSHPRILKAREHFTEWAILGKRLEALRSATEAGDAAALMSQLSELVAEYRPESEVHDLVYAQQENAAVTNVMPLHKLS